ncbi:MAG: Crp/Fnr family transcriptional regulator [Tannerellaceae bacterium]|jgi:signal-transduction protein with cAMP-binding, CBS, and nucleotidyltransferase domain|nr:Crp/Fnr family transcriptional regulator [Tannerellaceae bacterium]
MREKIIAQKISAKYSQLSSKSIDELASILERKQINKHKLVLREKETLSSLYYVDQGLLRMFCLKKGHDMTDNFISEDNICVDVSGFLKKVPTGLMIETLEASVLYEIPYLSLMDLAEYNSELSSLYRIIIERALMESYQKWDVFRFATAKERYVRFMKDFPSIVIRVPLLYIASYLAMSPETLSRVRGAIFSSNK